MRDLRKRESDSVLTERKRRNIMRKILLLTVCCALVCSLSGCIVFRRGSSNEYRSDEELADEMIENIIDCAEKEDAKALTELFSQYAEDSTLNLAEQAEEFIEFFQGQCKSWKEMQVPIKKVNTEKSNLAGIERAVFSYYR